MQLIYEVDLHQKLTWTPLDCAICEAKWAHDWFKLVIEAAHGSLVKYVGDLSSRFNMELSLLM